MSARGAARLLLGALLLAACHREAPLPPPDATYTVRGQVLALPAAPGGELTLHHEAIPQFRDRKGRPSPMDSMTMPFATAPALSLQGIARGDKVEMTFELRWESTAPIRVVALRKLPASTELHFGGHTLEPVSPLGTGAPGATPTPAATSSPVSAPPLDTAPQPLPSVPVA